MTKKEQRQAVFNKFDGHCAYCGCVLDKSWQLDHMIPVVRSLKTGVMEKPENDHIDNMMPACRSCNKDKSSESLENWRSLLANKIAILNRDISAYRFAKRYGLVAETEMPVLFYFEKIQGGE